MKRSPELNPCRWDALVVCVVILLAALSAITIWGGEKETGELTVVISVDGEEVSRTRFGIRTVTILEIEDAPASEEAMLAKQLKETPQLVEWDRNEGSSCFHLLVNGIRIFCTGANWVPCEPFPSAETDEKLRLLVHRAAEGGYNMLRVWGGGIYEPEVFYDLCDREGILIWHDFMNACTAMPDHRKAFQNLKTHSV